MADFTLTVYQPDDTTPLFEVGTAAAHANPFLQTPEQFGEAEIDLENGKALIGQVNVRVIDPQVGADQTERFLTALLADASGFSSINGSRAVLRRADPDPEVLLDGVGYGVVLSETFAGFSLQIRDIRERARKLSVFGRSGTSTVLPRGVLTGYGRLPTPTNGYGGGRLAPPTAPLRGVFRASPPAGPWSGGWVELDGAPSSLADTPVELIVTDTMADVLEHIAPAPGPINPTAGYTPAVFDQVSVLWRAEGSGAPWNALSNMNAGALSLSAEVRTARRRGGVVKTVDAYTPRRLSPTGTRSEVRAATEVYLSNSGTGAIPVNGARVELVIRYDGPPSEAYPLHVEGTWGTFVRDLLRGDYCGLDESGSPSDPRIRYDEDLLTDPAGPFTLPIRARIMKPRDDLREVLEELCKAIGAAPALNEAGEIAPIRYALPDATVTLPEINDGNAQAIPGWDHPADNAITVVEVAYPRDFLVPAEADPLGSRSAGDGIASRDVTIRRAPAALVAALGEQELKVDAWMFRALGGADGRPYSGDVSDETGSLLAVERQHQALDRFGLGGVTSFVKLRAADFPGVKEGDWVLDARSWRPNYQTGERGGNALAQIVSLRRLNAAWWEARLIDAGPADMPLGQPTIGAVTASDEGVVSVPVTALPAGGEARVDYAISETLPAATSPLWIFLGRTAALETLSSPALPAGATVWIRARGEKEGRRPSAWINASSLDTSSVARVIRVGLVIDGTDAVTSWETNAFGSGMRLYYDVHDPEDDPDPTLYVEFDAVDQEATLALSVGPGEMVTVDFEPWTGWGGSAVSGTAGAKVRRAAYRPDESGIGPGSVTPEMLTKGSQRWVSTVAFSATNHDTVAWAAGTITFADGTAYTIAGGNTGAMAAAVYVFLDPDVSATVLQVTTNPVLALGERRVLVATAWPTSDTAQRAAFVQVQGTLGLNSANLGVNSIEANHIKSISLTVLQAVINNLGAVTANLGTITAGLARSADSRFQVDFTNALLSVADGAGVTRVRLGLFGGQYGAWIYDASGNVIVGPTGLGSGTVGTAQMVAGSVVASKLTESSRGFNTTFRFSATDNNTVAWTAGDLTLSDGSTYAIAASDTGNMAAESFIYWDPATNAGVLQTTTNYATATGERKLFICYAKPIADTAQRAMYVPAVGIWGANSENLQVGSVNANHVTAVNLSVIQAHFTSLSAVTANLGVVTAGIIRNAANTTGIVISGAADPAWTSYISLLPAGGWFLYSRTAGGYETLKFGHAGEITIAGDLILDTTLGNRVSFRASGTEYATLYAFDAGAGVAGLNFLFAGDGTPTFQAYKQGSARWFAINGGLSVSGANTFTMGGDWYLMRHSNGNFDIGRNGTPYFYFDTAGDAHCLLAGGSWNDYSDERLKRNVSVIPDNLARGVMRVVAGVRYRRTTANSPWELGFSAQALQAVLPEAVHAGTRTVDGVPNAMSIAYGRMTPVLWNAVRDIDQDLVQLLQAIRSANSLADVQAAIAA